MKEMIYGNNKFEILDIGNYKDKDYVIISMMGCYPCAYVHSDIDYRDKYEFEGPAHGGFTFYNSLSHWKNNVELDEETKQFFSKNFIGWDYGHLGDFTYLLSFEGEKKWTTEEIFENVKEVIEWMLEKEKNNK